MSFFCGAIKFSSQNDQQFNWMANGNERTNKRSNINVWINVRVILQGEHIAKLLEIRLEFQQHDCLEYGASWVVWWRNIVQWLFNAWTLIRWKNNLKINNVQEVQSEREKVKREREKHVHVYEKQTYTNNLKCRLWLKICFVCLFVNYKISGTKYELKNE